MCNSSRAWPPTNAAGHGQRPCVQQSGPEAKRNLDVERNGYRMGQWVAHSPGYQQRLERSFVGEALPNMGPLASGLMLLSHHPSALVSGWEARSNDLALQKCSSGCTGLTCQDDAPCHVPRDCEVLGARESAREG